MPPEAESGSSDCVLKASIKHGMSLGNLGHYFRDNLLRRGILSSRCSGSARFPLVHSSGWPAAAPVSAPCPFPLEPAAPHIAAPTGSWHCEGSESGRDCSGVSGVPCSNMIPRYRSAPPFALIWSYLYFWMTVALIRVQLRGNLVVQLFVFLLNFGLRVEVVIVVAATTVVVAHCPSLFAAVLAVLAVLLASCWLAVRLVLAAALLAFALLFGFWLLFPRLPRLLLLLLLFIRNTELRHDRVHDVVAQRLRIQVGGLLLLLLLLLRF